MTTGTTATLRPVDLEQDLPLLHAWVTHPRSRFWQMGEATPDDVAAAYSRVAADPHHHAWLGSLGDPESPGSRDGEPAFLTETYDPRRAREVGLADLPELREGDLGMHVLVGPPAPGVPPRPGHTRRCFAAVLEHCFADPAVQRVVVEPDVGNDRIAVLNAEAGFVVARHVELPGKTAALSFCTRADWEAHR